ncbi:MAG TPA: hypothetical protein VKB29_15165 [Candidatus Binataceae bacterium]|nr:hypothetical protein [Candidatus Binataceae bacterium]
MRTARTIDTQRRKLLENSYRHSSQAGSARYAAARERLTIVVPFDQRRKNQMSRQGVCGVGKLTVLDGPCPVM